MATGDFALATFCERSRGLLERHQSRRVPRLSKTGSHVFPRPSQLFVPQLRLLLPQLGSLLLQLLPRRAKTLGLQGSRRSPVQRNGNETGLDVETPWAPRENLGFPRRKEADAELSSRRVMLRAPLEVGHPQSGRLGLKLQIRLQGLTSMKPGLCFVLIGAGPLIMGQARAGLGFSTPISCHRFASWRLDMSVILQKDTQVPWLVEVCLRETNGKHNFGRGRPTPHPHKVMSLLATRLQLLLAFQLPLLQVGLLRQWGSDSSTRLGWTAGLSRRPNSQARKEPRTREAPTQPLL